MRNLKRTLSLALASVMLVGMMSVGASAVNASDFTDADEIVNKDAVSTMTALGIINGKEDGSYFDPTGNVTRAEMAKMLCVAINGGVDPVLGVKDTPTFTDIKGTWAESYIEYCAANGIIAGRGNNKFDPTGTVSATEAAKMLLGVLGYSAEKSGLVGNDWAINTNVLANQNGLYKKLANLNANTLLTRDNAAQMIYNALDANMVELNAAGNYTTSQYSYTGTESVVTGTERVWVVKIKDSSVNDAIKALDGSVYNSRQDAIDTLKEANGGTTPLDTGKYTLEQKTQNVYGENTVTKYADETMGHKYLSLITDGDAVLTDVEKDSKGTYTLYMNGITTKGQYTKVEGDYSNLIGQKVEVLYKDRENVYGVYASTDSSLIVESTAGKVEAVKNGEVKIDGTTYKVDSNVTTTALYTGKLIDGLNVGGNKAAAVKAYDNDDNGKIDTVVYVPFTAAKVTYVGEKSFNTDVNPNVKFEDVNAYDDMAKNDYVIKSDAANTVDDTDTYVLAETVKGKIEATKSNSVRIDGTWYNYVTTTPDKDLALDSTVKAAVLNGYIVKSEVVTASHELKDYALIVNTAKDINGEQAKLLFADGTTKVVTTDVPYDGTSSRANVGDLVTYEVKKGEYVLTKAETSDKDKAGFDLILANTYENKSGKGKIGGESIADDAVIFVMDNNNKYSTMTGADFAKYDKDSVKAIKNAYANKDNSTGYNSVVLAYVELNAKVNSITSNYGYVTSAVSTTKNKDGETVSSFTFWDGATEHKDIMTDERVSLSKGDIFTYEENKDGIYTVTEVDNLLRTAIIAYNEKNGDIRFTDASLSDKGSNVNAEITKDTVIIGINSDDKAGVEGAVPTIAIETDKSGVYQANAYYVMGAGDEVKLLVVDTYGNIPAVNSVITVTDPSNLKDTWNKYADVRLDASKISKAESVNVPADKTLTLTGTNDTNKLTVTVESGATLKVNATQIANGKLEITLKAGGAVVLSDGSVLGKGGIVSCDSDVTIAKTASGVSYTTSGVVTIGDNYSFSDSNTFVLNGSVVGAKEGVKITIGGTAPTGTGVGADKNFYSAAGGTSTPGTKAALQNNSSYVWGTVYTDGSGTTGMGWVKQ
ncbi:S-layer homology domain-containing protein [Flavonifractor plautii]|uniref:S-layer homology domain-containing protein n=1 Tax=Flavonifractor plautii TaxID=292800 RepID=A0AAW6C682_FLAPL|nr:S-layer homology domain-containing protein [Flavonifractor plautii]MDB7890717.1 S-layer homology domain-containing protein [Flavonifractor plautii]MDB7907339.1 S-layer homology domain-containing protein [Flavonifractor plautii]